MKDEKFEDTPLNQVDEAKEILEETKMSETDAPVDLIEDELEESVRIISPASMVVKRFFRSRLSVIGLVTIIIMFAFVFLGPLFSPWGEITTDKTEGKINYTITEIEFVGNDGEVYKVYDVEAYQSQQNVFAPSFSINSEGKLHILGTDKMAMDVFTRLMYGGRISISLSFMVVIIETLLGVLLGGLSGYLGKWVDMFIMRIIDVINCVPTLPLMLIISAILEGWKVPDKMRIYWLMGFLTLISWTGVARIVRGQILSLREQEYITAADALGFSTSRKIFKHLLPNVMPQLIVSMTLGLGSMILYDATLGYLDLGVPLPYASWGKMINSATDPEVLRNYWNVWFAPGLCIVITVLAFNFVGDGLRDALDPRMKR